MTVSVTVNDLIKAHLASLMLELNTSLPAKIVSFDPATCLAAVQPAPKRRLVDGTLVNLPQIANCPVAFPNSTDFAIAWELKEGDSCFVCIAQRSIDRWIDGDGDVYDPVDNRRFALADAWVIPGGAPTSKVPPCEAGKMIFGMVDGTVTLKIDFATGELEFEGTAIKIGAAATEALIKGNAFQTYFNTHIHSGVTAGPGNTGTPVVTMPASTLSTKVSTE